MTVFYTNPQPFHESVHLRTVKDRTFLTANWDRVSMTEALEAARKAHPQARVSGQFVFISSQEGDFMAVEVFLKGRK